MARSPLDAVEFFHLQVLRVLAAGGDRDRLALKGGANLRFFFDSPRLSEDMDFDTAIAPTTLGHKVDRLIEAAALLLPLRSKGITIDSWSAPKQTETTQRWKFSLRVESIGSALHTKIEFSRR